MTLNVLLDNITKSTKIHPGKKGKFTKKFMTNFHKLRMGLVYAFSISIIDCNRKSTVRPYAPTGASRIDDDATESLFQQQALKWTHTTYPKSY